MALVAEQGRWYDIAAADELASGHMKPFAAGGVLGYLVNVEGRLHAVSALCTHMGCRLKPEAGRLALRCLCHGAQFSADGRVLAGPAPQPLPTPPPANLGLWTSVPGLRFPPLESHVQENLPYCLPSPSGLSSATLVPTRAAR